MLLTNLVFSYANLIKLSRKFLSLVILCSATLLKFQQSCVNYKEMLNNLCCAPLNPRKEVPCTLGMAGIETSHTLLTVLFLSRMHWPVSTSAVIVVSSLFYVAISTSIGSGIKVKDQGI